MAKNSDRFDNSDGQEIRATLSVRCDMTTGAAQATLTHDLDALGVTQNQLHSIPADAKVIGGHVECEEPIVLSGTTTAVGLTVGIVGTVNGFLTTANLVGMVAGEKSDLGGLGTLIGRLRATTAPALVAVATASGGAAVMTEVDEGVFWVHLEYVVAKGRVSQS